MRESKKLEYKSSFDNEVIETLCAFANTKGGRVIIGINDHGRILGVNIGKESIQNWINEIKTKTTPSIIPDVEEKEVQDKPVIEFFINEYPVKPVAFRGRYYKRVNNSNHLMSTEEVANLHLQTFNMSWDYYIDNEHTLEQISLKKAANFIKFANQNNFKGINDNPMNMLKKHELLRNGKISRACYLLFMKGESLLSTIELGRFQSPAIIKDAMTVKADLISEVDSVMEFIKKHLNKEYIITGKARREEKWTYPLDALREIVLNMIVHRDYAMSSDSIIKIYNDRIEFYNPGRLLPGLTVKKLMKGDYVSNIRNKQIAEMFKELGEIEKYGSGIARIINAFEKHGLKKPRFAEVGDGFMVVGYSSIQGTTKGSSQKSSQKGSQKSSQKILRLMQENPHATIGEIAVKVGIGDRAVKKQIAALKEKGLLKRMGSDREGYWQVSGGKE